MSVITGKIEQKDRSGFRVKFTGGEKKKAATGKEMILGERHRANRDFTSFCAKEMKSQETESNFDEESNASKRELKQEMVTPKIIEYT